MKKKKKPKFIKIFVWCSRARACVHNEKTATPFANSGTVVLVMGVGERCNTSAGVGRRKGCTRAAHRSSSAAFQWRQKSTRDFAPLHKISRITVEKALYSILYVWVSRVRSSRPQPPSLDRSTIIIIIIHNSSCREVVHVTEVAHGSHNVYDIMRITRKGRFVTFSTITVLRMFSGQNACFCIPCGCHGKGCKSMTVTNSCSIQGDWEIFNCNARIRHRTVKPEKM